MPYWKIVRCACCLGVLGFDGLLYSFNMQSLSFLTAAIALPCLPEILPNVEDLNVAMSILLVNTSVCQIYQNDILNLSAKVV
jgi:hypothetical protein